MSTVPRIPSEFGLSFVFHALDSIVDDMQQGPMRTIVVRCRAIVRISMMRQQSQWAETAMTSAEQRIAAGETREAVEADTARVLGRLFAELSDEERAALRHELAALTQQCGLLRGDEVVHA